MLKCNEWLFNVINELKTREKLQGQHKSNTILHTTYLGRLVLIEETPVGSAHPKLEVYTSCVRLGEMGLAHLHQPGQTNPSRYQKIPTALEAFLVMAMMTKI